MNSQLAGQAWFEETLALNDKAIADSGLPWLEAMRTNAKTSIHQLPIPNRKQEAWRYSRPEKLYEHPYFIPVTSVTALDEDDIVSWVYPESESYRLVFANGYFVPELSSQVPAIANWFSQSQWHDSDIFSALNFVLMSDGLYIYLPQDSWLDKPIEVAYLSFNLEQQVAAQLRSLVVLDAGARARLIEHFVSPGNSDYFASHVSELFLGQNAELEHYRLQDESHQAHHLSRISVRQHTASEYRSVNLAVGGAWSRADIQVRFTGPQATCELEGVYTVGETQYSDFHLDIQHDQPMCRSRENFRGIIHGRGQAVFDGRILVAKDAQKTDALLTNKNLLLSEDAEVDTKPQLEIYADDVKCGHGTTVGRLDPDQIYYLRSRGIAESVARRMLSLGFAEQILEHTEDEQLHAAMARLITAQFAKQRLVP